MTAITGWILLVLLAVLGLTIVRIGQLLWLHLFLGLLLMGPLALKLASTGYRLVRYYMHDAPYRIKGPPPPWLRALAPLLVLSTFAVFVTGVLLLVEGPGSRNQLLLLHKVSFFVWLAATAPHVLGHLTEPPRWVRATEHDLRAGRFSGPGSAGRAVALASAVVAGAVVAIVLLPDFGAWTSAQAHHHRG